MKPSDLLLFTATIALIACSKSDAANDAAASLPASTQDSAATAAAVAPVAVPSAVPAAPPASTVGTVARSKPTAVASGAKPAVAPSSVAPVAGAPSPQPAPVNAPPVVAPVAAAPAPAENAADGKAVYDANCKKCHGAAGTPSAVMKKKFDKLAAFDAAFFARRSVDSIVTILEKGKNESMKSFKDKLSADEMKAVAAYIRSLAR
jgi:mono/diheme cytochrome c family protein